MITASRDQFEHGVEFEEGTGHYYVSGFNGLKFIPYLVRLVI